MTVPALLVPRPRLDISHHRIHEGNHFKVHKISLGINKATPKYFLIIPPPIQPDGSIIEIHLIFEVDSDTGATLEFFENPTITDNGTELTIINNNRRSTTTSQSSVFEDPTITDDGTILFEERLGTNTKTSVELGEYDRDEEEYILDENDTYILKFTPLLDDTNITMELSWYDNRPSSPIPIP